MSGAVAEGIGLAKGIRERFFPTKTPEQIERDRLSDQRKKRKKKGRDSNEAFDNAREGKTDDLESMLNDD